jgi:hypothetical protein
MLLESTLRAAAQSETQKQPETITKAHLFLLLLLITLALSKLLHVAGTQTSNTKTSAAG